MCDINQSSNVEVMLNKSLRFDDHFEYYEGVCNINWQTTALV